MAVGIDIDGISFTEQALLHRPDHAAVLGRIFTSWSLIETTVAGLLGLMMHADHRAALAILGTFKTNSSRVNAVKKVGRVMLEPPLQSKFDALMKAVLAYAEERNAIAHNLWGVKADEPDVVYRMPMSAISDLLVEAPHKVPFNAEETVASFTKQMTPFTVQDLEAIEQRGRNILTRIMNETTQKVYSRTFENSSLTGSCSA